MRCRYINWLNIDCVQHVDIAARRATAEAASNKWKQTKACVDGIVLSRNSKFEAVDEANIRTSKFARRRYIERAYLQDMANCANVLPHTSIFHVGECIRGWQESFRFLWKLCSVKVDRKVLDFLVRYCQSKTWGQISWLRFFAIWHGTDCSKEWSNISWLNRCKSHYRQCTVRSVKLALDIDLVCPKLQLVARNYRPQHLLVPGQPLRCGNGLLSTCLPGLHPLASRQSFCFQKKTIYFSDTWIQKIFS